MGEWMDEGMNGSEHNHLSIGCNVIREKRMKLYSGSQICRSLRRIQHEAAQLSLDSYLFRFQPPGPVRARPDKKILAVANLAISLCVEVQCANQLPTIDLRRITDVFRFSC